MRPFQNDTEKKSKPRILAGLETYQKNANNQEGPTLTFFILSRNPARNRILSPIPDSLVDVTPEHRYSSIVELKDFVYSFAVLKFF